MKNKNTDKKLTPAQQVVQLSKQLAHYKKSNEALAEQFKKHYIATNGITKEQLDEAYDPANPTATTDALNAHNKNITDAFNKIIEGVNTTTEDFIKSEYSPEKIDTQSHLALWADANKSELTYEQLMDEVPNRILKKMKVEGANLDEVFKEASEYLSGKQAGGVYTPQPPHSHGGSSTPEGDDEMMDDGEEPIY